MLKLPRARQQAAAEFIRTQARPLDRALYAHHFLEADEKPVLAELSEFQNPDGGFGHALEPDVLLPDSSVIATTVGLQILRELGAKADDALVAGAVSYLLDTFDEAHLNWHIIPPNVDDAPHAPWWQYDPDLSQSPGNPRPEVLGYLLDWADQAPADMLEVLSESVLAHLQALPDAMGMHDLLCYLRLHQAAGLPETMRAAMAPKLQAAALATVGREPAQWDAYGLKPWQVAPGPDAPFADALAEEIVSCLDYEIGRQDEDGSWQPNWSWGDQFPEAWENAKREWSGELTLRTLLVLRAFGRLE